MHKILNRQIEKIFGSIENMPQECLPFIEAVDQTYADYDKEYKLIERALEISSKELTEANERLRDDNKATKKYAEELETVNKTMIDRELKMVELKKEIAKLKKRIRQNKSVSRK